MAKLKTDRVGDPDDPILARLDTLIHLLIPNARLFANEVSSLQREILALCDYEHTTQQICASTKKTATHVNKELSLLRARGFVKTVKRDGRSVHIRLQASRLNPNGNGE
jgi:hypothetical protein